MIPWQEVFSRSGLPWLDGESVADPVIISAIPDLKKFLDAVHIRFCLVRPYQEMQPYPLVEGRELLPSFEGDIFEYKDLPGFSMVAFERPLDYFSEIFQYDILHPVSVDASGRFCPLENQVNGQNLNTLSARLPRFEQAAFRDRFQYTDTTVMDSYPALMPHLAGMDRAHVLALGPAGLFHLAGVFASFPSDIDSEVKRFGIRIGKFAPGDNELYERNRLFVYQFLMELYGFPIVSERRTSSALFARKLHKLGERFLLRVIGQSDRTLTTYVSLGENRRYPHLEKIALVRVDEDQEEALARIGKEGYFLDAENRVVIMRVAYRQHRYDPSNLRQDRALSVASQEILHPLTGQPLRGLNIVRDTTNMFLRLNDIVRGEFSGRIIYKRTEIVENTDTDEKRLKFLYAWLAKHQRRMISYSDDFFGKVNTVLANYLFAQDNMEVFEPMRELRQEVVARLSYIQQARRVSLLEDISERVVKGVRIGYLAMTRQSVELLGELKFEIVNFFPALVSDIINCVEKILHDRYLQRNYIEPPESSLTGNGQEIRKNYGRIVALLDEFKAVRKARMAAESRNARESVAQ